MKDVRDRTTLLECLKELSAGVARRLKRECVAGSKVKLKLRWADFTTVTRQVSSAQPVRETDEVFALAHKLLEANWPQGKAVRLMGVGVSGLCPLNRQLSLWEAGAENTRTEKERRLQAVVETLQDRFGSQVVHLGKESDEAT